MDRSSRVRASELDVDSVQVSENLGWARKRHRPWPARFQPLLDLSDEETRILPAHYQVYIFLNCHSGRRQRRRLEFAESPFHFVVVSIKITHKASARKDQGI